MRAYPGDEPLARLLRPLPYRLLLGGRPRCARHLLAVIKRNLNPRSRERTAEHGNAITIRERQIVGLGRLGTFRPIQVVQINYPERPLMT